MIRVHFRFDSLYPASSALPTFPVFPSPLCCHPESRKKCAGNPSKDTRLPDYPPKHKRLCADHTLASLIELSYCCRKKNTSQRWVSGQFLNMSQLTEAKSHGNLNLEAQCRNGNHGTPHPISETARVCVAQNEKLFRHLSRHKQKNLEKVEEGCISPSHSYLSNLDGNLCYLWTYVILCPFNALPVVAS